MLKKLQKPWHAPAMRWFRIGALLELFSVKRSEKILGGEEVGRCQGEWEGSASGWTVSERLMAEDNCSDP